MSAPDPHPNTTQPEPESSSDGDGSWTADPITQDPHEDRSVDSVIAKTQGGARKDRPAKD